MTFRTQVRQPQLLSAPLVFECRILCHDYDLRFANAFWMSSARPSMECRVPKSVVQTGTHNMRKLALQAWRQITLCTFLSNFSEESFNSSARSVGAAALNASKPPLSSKGRSGGLLEDLSSRTDIPPLGSMARWWSGHPDSLVYHSRVSLGM